MKFFFYLHTLKRLPVLFFPSDWYKFASNSFISTLSLSRKAKYYLKLAWGKASFLRENFLHFFKKI